MKNKVVIIAGPTATGKTALAIEVAKLYNGVVVNFDSLLFYQELSIGTCKPSLEEMQGVKHFLVGTDSAKNPLNANQFMKKALPIIEEQLKLDRLVILVGGSGFYLQALLEGMVEDLSTPVEIRQKSDQLYEQMGIEPFLKQLQEIDSESFARLHANDHYRVRRAVEYFWTTGISLSSANAKLKKMKEERGGNAHGWKLLDLYLDIPKVEHLPIIYKRTEEIIKMGLIDEVKGLLAQGFTGKEKPLESIGYKEAQSFLAGDLTETELKEEIDIATRQLAKAQRTWFKGQKKTFFHPLRDRELILKMVKEFHHGND